MPGWRGRQVEPNVGKHDFVMGDHRNNCSRRNATFRMVVALAGCVLIALSMARATAARQESPPEPVVVAFRVDANQVIATLKVFDTSAKQIRDGLSAEPMARFGYRYFDPPAAWREQGAVDMRAGDRWLIHSAPGQAFRAEAERIVGGNAGCQDAIGVLLRVVPEELAAFTAVRAKYFLAERSRSPQPSKAESGSTVGVATPPSITESRRALESTLGALLARELPRIRADAATDIARMASSSVDYHRSWARHQQAVEEGMQAGRGVLTYDIQSFRLAPDGVLLHFVRAEWTVQRRQGFAASLWLRGERPMEVIQTNLRPASWLRMFEFQGSVAREHLGLVLNVFDRDRDGWGEVLMAQEGYESVAISLLEYSPDGFQPTGIEYAHGC